MTEMKNNRWLLPAAVLAAFLSAGKAPENGISGKLLVYAEESDEAENLDDLLIEDDGEEIAVHEGADLDELRAAEAQETEAQTEVIELEDPQLQLEPASVQKLQEHLEQLGQMDSPIGSDGELIVGRYIKAVMEEMGYTISEQSFHEGFLNEAGVDAPGINIIAERGADAQERHRDILIISTHYDSKTSPEEEDPLANDKSGAAVLLEMARILSYEETDTDICFLFLSGEEDGLYGSANFVKSLEEEHRDRVAGVLYVEAVGYGMDYAYQIKTVDGQENELGNLIREEGWFSENMILSMDEEQGELPELSGDNPETPAAENPGEEKETEGKNQNWLYVPDDQTSQKSFADAGWMAVTVCQDVKEQLAEKRELLSIDIGDLQKITDILATAAGRIMSETTGSFLK